VKAARLGKLPGTETFGRAELLVPGSPPAMPDYLKPEAIDVWQEEIGRVMAAGVVEIDSSLFARYCSLEALVRQAFNAGDEPPPMAALTVLRQYGELLGIAGRKSRVGKVADDPTKTGNPFARNGSRPRP
jgi:phage terminase small subunit